MIDHDEPIVREVQAGRTEAFAKLVNRHKDRVYAIMLRLVGDRDAAEELAHESFVHAWRAIEGFRGQALFGTWIVQIAIHLARDRMRARRRMRTVSLDALLEESADGSALMDTRSLRDPLSEISDRDMVKRLEAALGGLPHSYREVFVLHHIEDIPYEEIASMTGKSVGSLKVRAHRARKLLREAISPDAEFVAPDDRID
jgi:RNA polymerase sigma-70 factor (ECF subfamily)